MREWVSISFSCYFFSRFISSAWSFLFFVENLFIDKVWCSLWSRINNKISVESLTGSFSTFQCVLQYYVCVCEC